MKNTTYFDLSYYPKMLEKIKKRKETFELHETTYSRKIKIEKQSYFFNENGKKDDRILMLISNVRRDAKDFLDSGGITRDTNINFFNLVQKPESDEICYKIDLRAAYWNYALKRGIISPFTNHMFKELYKGEKNKVTKNARLKALGCLATTKKITPYIKGIPDYKNQIIKRENTYDLYMEVCRGIDEVIRECCATIKGCYYYYFDCVFVSNKFSDEACKYFADKDYDVGIEETKLEIIQHKNNIYICSVYDDKMYMVRPEHKYMLTGQNNDVIGVLKNEYSNEAPF